MFANFVKTVRLGTLDLNRDYRPGRHNWASVYVKIEYHDGRLSFSGVEGPLANGNCKGSCCQIGQSLRAKANHLRLARGWNMAMLVQLLSLWDRWHLNDLRAGSPAQEEYLRAHPVEVKSSENHYAATSKALSLAGLNPDGGFGGYRYGTAWNTEPVPAHVLEWLTALPDADRTPAWC
jgi:hypothetical protein